MTSNVSIPAFGLTVAAGLLCAACVLQADFKRRGIRANAYFSTGIAGLAGLAGTLVFSRDGVAWFAGILAGSLALTLVAFREKISLMEFLDGCSAAASAGYAVVCLGGFLSSDGEVTANQRLNLTPLYEFLIWMAIAALLWRMGTNALRIPKAKGEIFSSYLLLTGAARFLVEFTRIHSRSFVGLSNAQALSLLLILSGTALLWRIKSNFHRVKREHRILQHTATHGATLQPEYHRATPECPHPERWHMFDSMTAEVEVLDFLKALVKTVKPELVVETGAFMGISTLHIAQGLKENGFGRVVTCEYDATVFDEAKRRFLDSGLAEWIDLRNESSLEMNVDGRIDLLFCDSDPPLREREVRRFLPQVNPHGLIVLHDASSAIKTVREGALKLEREGVISVVFLPTPRGLVVAQKREGRS